MILKPLGLSQLIYSSSILNIPEGFANLVKTKLFKFLWKNKRDKIKRSGLYQDLDKGGLRMIDIEIMFKALKLAWIPILLSPGRQNWRTVPNYYLHKLGGLNFLLRCNYNPKHLNTLPSFCQNILMYFNELKNLYDIDQAQDLILFNNKEILIEGRPLFLIFSIHVFAGKKLNPRALVKNLFNRAAMGRARFIICPWFFF